MLNSPQKYSNPRVVRHKKQYPPPPPLQVKWSVPNDPYVKNHLYRLPREYNTTRKIK
jgi:hypothetical protein